MSLLEYLKQHNIEPYSRKEKAQAVYAALGVSRVHLWNIAKGERKPSPSLAYDIEDYTGGEVTARDLLVGDRVAA